MAQRIVAIHDSLETADVVHAFGGAIALAFHTTSPRATNDIDLNIAVGGEQARAVLAKLPPQVRWDGRRARTAEITGEVELRWMREGAVDLFFATGPYHQVVHARTERYPFAGVDLPVLCATDLAVFKATFGRPQDLVDIAAMVRAGSVATTEAGRWAGELGGEDAAGFLQQAIDLGTRPAGGR